MLQLSMRAINAGVRDELRQRVEDVARFQSKSYNAEVEFTWEVGYPATINDDAAVEIAVASIKRYFGEHAVSQLAAPMMFSEDFSFMLNTVACAYVLIGNGDSAGLHSTTYDFNDHILERGAAFYYHLAKDYFA